MINKVMPIFGKRVSSTVETPLLDTYGGASVAYSYRYLSTAFTGNSVVRVRRSSDNAELDFTPSEITDGTLTTWTGANDGLVTTLYDQSGNVINATQSTPALQPILVSGGVLQLENGLPTMNFTASQYLDASLSLQAQPNTYFVVNKVNPIFKGYLMDSTSSGNRNAQGNGDWIASGAVLSGAYPNSFWGNQSLLTMLFNSTSSSSYVNGAIQVTGNAGTRGMLGLRIGAAYNTAFSRFAGNIQEFIMYPTNQTVNRIGIETNINNHFTIY